MKKAMKALALFIVFALNLSSTTAFAGTLCSDGWVSSSSGRGTCSWHGGIYYSSTSNSSTTSKPKPVTFSSCATLYKKYPNGVGAPAYFKKPITRYLMPKSDSALYKANVKFDHDGIGIACARLVPIGSLYRMAAFGYTFADTSGLTLAVVSVTDDVTTDFCNAIQYSEPTVCSAILDTRTGRNRFIPNPNWNGKVASVTLQASFNGVGVSSPNVAFTPSLSFFGQPQQVPEYSSAALAYSPLLERSYKWATLYPGQSKYLDAFFFVTKSTNAMDATIVFKAIDGQHYVSRLGAGF